MHNMNPFPATTQVICRYIAYLSRSKAFSTIQQHLAVISVIHRHIDEHNPTQGIMVRSLMKGVKRYKGTEQKYKLTLSIQQIQRMFELLCIERTPDLQLWVMISMCFYGLLRIGAITVPSASSYAENKILTRGDIQFVSNGCVLTFRYSKTIQYNEREFHAVLPSIPNNPACPVKALQTFLQRSPTLDSTAPALAFIDVQGDIKVLTSTAARSRLANIFRRIGLSASDYNTHIH